MASHIGKVFLVADKWSADIDLCIFHQHLYEFSSELPQHIRMIRDNHYFFIFLFSLHCSCSTFYNAASTEYGKNGTKDAPDVHRKSCFSYVLSVKLCFYVYLEFVTSIDLRPAGKARLHIICTIFVSLCN